MIKMDVLRNDDDGDDHFIVRSDEPIRVEVVTDGSRNIHCFVYRGVEDDQYEEPVGVFDGSITDNQSWSE